MVITPKTNDLIFIWKPNWYKDGNNSNLPTKLNRLKCPRWLEINKSMTKNSNLQRWPAGHFWRFLWRPFECCPHAVKNCQPLEQICNRCFPWTGALISIWPYLHTKEALARHAWGFVVPCVQYIARWVQPVRCKRGDLRRCGAMWRRCVNVNTERCEVNYEHKICQLVKTNSLLYECPIIEKDGMLISCGGK